MDERFKILHRKMLSTIPTGKMDLSKSTDYALPILLQNSIDCEEYEISRLIQNEIDKRKNI